MKHYNPIPVRKSYEAIYAHGVEVPRSRHHRNQDCRTKAEGRIMRTLLTTLSSFMLLAASPAAGQEIDRAAPTSARGQAMIIEADEGGYADVVVAGDTVYLSGYVAGLREGETDLDAAYERAFRGMGAILAKAGVTWDDVVEITSYHTNIGTQIDSYSKVRRRYVKPPFPASTVIQVVRLIPDRGLTEIRLTARKTKKS